jgi:hypothetical protein
LNTIRGCCRISRSIAGPGRYCFGASYSQLPGCRVGKKFDVLDALPEFIEHGHAPLDDRATVMCGFNAPASAIEKSHAEYVFKFRY